jgi:hypothetical protein
MYAWRFNTSLWYALPPRTLVVAHYDIVYNKIAGRILDCKEPLSVYNVQQSSILRGQLRPQPPGTACCNITPPKSISITATSTTGSFNTSSNSPIPSPQPSQPVPVVPTIAPPNEAETKSLTWLASVGFPATPAVLEDLRTFHGNHHALYQHYKDLVKLNSNPSFVSSPAQQ